ncbi:MAG: hypothetical protein M3Y13_05495 [Armatimonadota bacterium]|nr:hypothetical protein [Armatimonadota bacterium]
MRLRISAIFLLPILLLGSIAPGRAAAPGSIPIIVTLPKAGLTTIVIEDAKGNRVRNLIAETPLPAGKTTLYWDGYDEGVRGGGNGDIWEQGLTRHRVPPGTYTVRGLVHDRLALRYEFSVNSPGTPPWKTADGSGGWLADHSPAGDILCLPQGAPAPNGKGTAHFLVCSSTGESGEEFVWLDANGRRLYGTNTGFWGGTHLARDPGANPDSDYYAYTFISGERDSDNNTLEVRGFNAEGRLETVFHATFPMEWKKSILPTFKTTAEAYGTNGLAVYNGRVVVAWTRRNALLIGDARTKKQVAEIPIPAPRGIAFDPQGRLFVITGNSVKRYRLSDDGTKLTEEATLIGSGLEDPHRLALDDAGNIYVADWGGSHQIKVFSPDGRPLRVIGKPGGPQIGRYDERGMSHPCGMTVDDAGRLWVTEAEVVPKRLSIWDAHTGAFERAIYGPSQYGGGGKIDPADPTRLFMDPDWSAGIVTWSLDWKAGTGKPVAVAWRNDNPNVDAMPSTAPETVFRRGGFQYLTDSYNDYLRYNQDRGVGLWRLGSDSAARPVALFGNGADLVNQTWGIPLRHRAEIVKLWQNLDPATVFFVWTDKNGDRIAEPDEITFRQVPSPKDGQMLKDVGLGVQVEPDLSLITTWGIHVAPPTLDARGTPHYDLNKITWLGDPAQYSERVPGGSDVVYLRVGALGLTSAAFDGSRFWQYQSVSGGQPGPGQLTQPTRLMGLPVTPRKGDTGAMFTYDTDRGGISLLTTDGLYLQTLGGDMRYIPLWRMPASETHRGMNLDGISFEDEQFHPTMTQTESDGTIYLVVGKEHSSITRLDGLETVQRLAGPPVTVDAAQIADLPEVRIEAARKTARNTLAVAVRQSAPIVDGDLSDWPADTSWAVLDARASAAVTLSGDRLYAAYKTGDPNALVNAGGDLPYLFKKGGALDLMIRSDPASNPHRQAPVAGDERLLVTQVNGQTKAVLYRAVVEGTAASARVEFASPVGRVDFDQVADVSDQVTLAQKGGDIEFSVPLSALGLSVKPGDEILGDLGLLRGNAGQTTRRLYWNNQNAQIVSDVPSEARLSPGNWGLWQIK